MSLADNIRELEDELEHYKIENSRLRSDISQSEDRIDDLEYDCDDMGKFIEYVDETHPELRVAYEATLVLEGVKT